jgi:hypothetical protein
MSEDEIDDLAYGIVEDYLDEGPEFISVAEVVSDNADDPDDDDFRAVHDKVREYLADLHRRF